MSLEEDQLYNKSSNDCIVTAYGGGHDDDVVSNKMSGGTDGRADDSLHTSDGTDGQNVDVASNHDSISTSGRTHGHVDDVVPNDYFPTLDVTYVDMADNNLLDTSGVTDGHDGVLPDDSLLMNQLDELLQSEQISSTTTHGLHDCAGEEFVEDNMVLSSCMDDILFSSLNDVNEELPQLIMDSWALDDYNDINTSCINNAPLNFMQGDEEVCLNMNMHPEEGLYSTKVSSTATAIDNNVVASQDDVMLNDDGEESMSQMFSEWLKCNSHAISLADMRKITLKTSTIEDTMRRLGGGKKGLMLFVKCVLMWIQNFHMNSSSSSSSNSSNNDNINLGSMELPKEVPSNLISILGGITTPFDELAQHDEINSQKPYCYNSDGVNTSGHVTMMPSRTVMTSSMSLSGDISSMTSPRDGCTATSSSTSISTESSNNNPFLDKTWNNIQHEANDINDSTSWTPTNMFSSMTTNHMAPVSCQLGTTIPSLNNDDVAKMMPQPGHCDVNATRAARKSRMERQRWSVRSSTRSRKLRSGSTLEANYGRQSNHVRCRRRNHVLSSVYSDQYNLPILAHGGHHGNLTSLCTQAIMEGKAVNLRPISQSYVDSEHGQHKVDMGNKKLRLLFHKELKQSDVGSLGRIVLPKKYAETCLPYLEFRDGVNLAVEDFSSTKIWSMRYRFWPNNKSRMYLIENTGDFVKSYKLREGDYMLLYFNLQSNRYVMLGAKGEIEELLRGGVPRDLCSSISSEQEVIDNHHDTSMNFGPCSDALTNSEESCDDPLLAEFIEQSLEDFKDSSEDSVTLV